MTTTTTTTTTPMPSIIKESVLLGNSDNALLNAEYYSNGSSYVLYSEDLNSPITSIVRGDDTNKFYISTRDNLYIYEICSFSSGTEASRYLTLSNSNNTIFSLYRKNNNTLWGLQSSNGKVLKMNPTTLAITKEYDDMDAPFKVKYSEFHNAYFVAGSHILWQIDDNTGDIEIKYEINNYTIKDFDVSESGVVCLLLKGINSSIIRILKNDVYSFLLNQSVDNVSFCKYCEAGRFYVISEIISGSTVYSAQHYLYDSIANTLITKKSVNEVLVTTTTTTEGTTSKAILIKSPTGGEQLQNGKEYDIKWISSKSSNDSVKIELYKGELLYQTLSEKTQNTGIFSWKVQGIDEGLDYKLKITWLSANSDSNSYDLINGTFAILDNVTTTTTTTTTAIPQQAIGIDYGKANEWILIVLANGMGLIYDLMKNDTYGLINMNILNVSSMSNKSIIINGFDLQNKVRVFVGSQMYISDMWDSGIIETNLKSMVYGGGNNLVSGQRYYAHIQTYSKQRGWGEIQIKEFVMPNR